MSVSIYFTQLNKDKVEAAWKDILSGKFEQEVEELKYQKAILEKQMPALEAELAKYADKDPDYLYYSKDPVSQDYKQADYAKEKLRREIRSVEIGIIGRTENLKELQAALVSQDKEAIIRAIIIMDGELIDFSAEKSFSDYVSYYEEYIEVMFMGVLATNIRDQDFYETEGITGIPFNLWVELFQQANSAVMKGMRDAITEIGSYSFEEFTAAILPIKDVVKFCHDTNTEMVVSYEGDPVPWQIRRAESIYDKYYKDLQSGQ